jgi:hypothetical protein
MTDKLTIDVTDEQRARIETLARQHGYDTPGAYLLSLVEEEPTKEELFEEFREGWRDAMTGNTIPASKLRDFLNSDD